jgi:hypothetical protein
VAVCGEVAREATHAACWPGWACPRCVRALRTLSHQAGTLLLQQGREGLVTSKNSGVPASGPPLLFCFTSIHTRRVEGVRRGAVVRSIALCSPYGFVGQLHSLMDLALDRYFDSGGSVEVLEGLRASLNATDFGRCPRLTRCGSPSVRAVVV